MTTTNDTTKAVATITYRGEWTGKGWIVWRSVAGEQGEKALPGPRPHFAAQLAEKVEAAVRSDVASCTRLGLRAMTTEGDNTMTVHVYQPAK